MPQDYVHTVVTDPVSPWDGGPECGLPWRAYVVDIMVRVKHVLRKNYFIRN